MWHPLVLRIAIACSWRTFDFDGAKAGALDTRHHLRASGEGHRVPARLKRPRDTRGSAAGCRPPDQFSHSMFAIRIPARLPRNSSVILCPMILTDVQSAPCSAHAIEGGLTTLYRKLGIVAVCAAVAPSWQHHLSGLGGRRDGRVRGSWRKVARAFPLSKERGGRHRDIVSGTPATPLRSRIGGNAGFD